MKTLAIIAALLLPMTASADSLVARNNSGGTIVLTTDKGSCPDTYLAAYATAEPDLRMSGCWGYQKSSRLVWVIWEIVGPKPYPIDEFQLLRSF